MPVYAYGTYGIFLLWTLWSLFRDGIPYFALKDNRRYGPWQVLTLLPAAYGFGAAVALPLMGKLEWGYLAPIVAVYLLALAVVELAGAWFKKETKTVRGRTGFKMPYRVPVSLLIMIPLAVAYPSHPSYFLAYPLLLAAALGVLGKWKLVGAEYFTPEELAAEAKAQEKAKAKAAAKSA